MTTQAEVNLTLKGNGFVLNGLELSKEDLGLLLELLGFDVMYAQSLPVFFMNSLKSLSQLERNEFFEVFNDFVCFDQETRGEYRSVIAMIRVMMTPRSMN